MPSFEATPVPLIESRIFLIPGQRVWLIANALLYEVETRALNQAVRRNRERFPEDFMFRLNKQEEETLRSQIVTSNEGRGGRRYLPYAFTEQGIAMLSSVLTSKRAIAVNIAIMRTLVRLRQLLWPPTRRLRVVWRISNGDKASKGNRFRRCSKPFIN